MPLPKAYQPSEHEARLYQAWEASGFFNPDNLPNGPKRKPFTIAMPLPNITGELHLGHALMLTLQDLMIRFQRMRGRAALWIPGTDHAGISTQIVVEKALSKEGVNPKSLPREEFVKKIWEWKEQWGGRILEQVRAMGSSCDWSRYHFTLDPDYATAVREAFVRFYDAGLMYRGTRVIHWCVKDQTAVSDLEVGYREEEGKLFHIRYPLTDDPSQGIVVATTRPETLLGDTAVAVNPKDDRYKKFIGKTLNLPIVGTPIPVVADESVDKEFGTGAVKVTPAHDVADEAIAKRHKLPSRIVIGTDGKMTAAAGEGFAGLKSAEARETVVQMLRAQTLLEKTETFTHSVAYCERSNTPIEPLPLPQWFLKMEKLAKPALAAVQKGKITIVPDRFKKVYEQWLSNIRDWNVSRQLVWGHRIPVWTCDNGHEFASREEAPTKCAECASTNLAQDPDVLDTWFSSQLWTFATLGWPNTNAPDLKRFHPTHVMETGWDILFFWVARMVMASLYFVKEIPFQTVYLHGLVLDTAGKKMSKSKGTGIDPLPMGHKYGTDAVRLALTMNLTPGQDQKLTEPKIAGYRNFVNKLWNIARFVEGAGIKPRTTLVAKSLADQWILSRLSKTVTEVTDLLETFQFGPAGERLYEFTWHELADWYLEVAKIEKPHILPLLLQKTLKLWHPFAPFVTEALWQQTFPDRGMLMVAEWPKEKTLKRFVNEDAERLFKTIQDAVVRYRSERKEKNIPPAEPMIVALAGDDLLWTHREIIERLGRVTLQLPAAKLNTEPTA